MELRRYLAVVRKYLWLLVLTTVVGGGAAYYFSTTAPPVYRATTTLEIERGDNPLSDPFSSSSVRTAQSAANVFSVKLQSPPFQEKLKEKLNLGTDIEDMISVEQVGNTQFLRISAQSSDAALSQALANAAAEILIEQEATRQQARFQESLGQIEANINELETSIAETQAKIAALEDPESSTSELDEMEQSQLKSELNRDQTRLVVLLESAEDFRMAMARYADYISVYTPAEMATTAVGPRVTQNTLLGTASGLVIGLSIAFLLEYLDDTIKSPEDVKQHLSLGIMGAFPRLNGKEGRIPLVAAKNSFQPISEAFRNLRTSIQFSSVDVPLRTLLITSPLPSDGKTFTAANLAIVMAQGGQDVILVDADLRHPMHHRVFELSKEPGLACALLASTKEGHAVAGTETESAQSGDDGPQASNPAELLFSQTERGGVVQETKIKGLKIVTGGSHVHNPAELLASERFRIFVSWLKEQADVVIFDSPPVLAVTDAAVLSNLTDGTLLVVDCGQTRRPAAVQAMERLKSVGGNVLGAVLNRLAASEDGYGYYYHYYYYGEGDGAGKGERRSWIARVLRPGRGRR